MSQIVDNGTISERCWSSQTVLYHYTLSLQFVIHKIARVPLSIRENFDPGPLEFFILESTLFYSAIEKGSWTTALFHALHKLAFILKSVFIRLSALTVWLALCPVAFVHPTVGPNHLSSAV